MASIIPYLMMPIMALLLVLAQSLWASAIKTGHVLQGSLPTIVVNLATNWKMWLGAFIYIVATLVYFYMLSKLKFFSVQVTMTALSIVFSVGLSIFLFNERPEMINIVGIIVVLSGIVLVLYK